MPLEKPPLPHVNPGGPVTAQGWNAVVDGLLSLYDAVLALGTGRLAVSVQADGEVVRGATVVAVPDGGGSPVASLPLFGTATTYLVTGVSDGTFQVHVSAPGFRPAVVPATVPAEAPLTVTLTSAGAVVPDLFGLGLSDALRRLREANLEAGLMIDTLGHEISSARVPVEYQNSPVLAQLPVAGDVADPASDRMQLVVAAAVSEEPVVTVPNLAGLTQAEAAQGLERLGLRLGKVSVRTT
jgi:hypothetical protein